MSAKRINVKEVPAMVVYSNDTETLVAVGDQGERQILKEYFTRDTGRHTNDYNRIVIVGVVEINKGRWFNNYRLDH